MVEVDREVGKPFLLGGGISPVCHFAFDCLNSESKCIGYKHAVWNILEPNKHKQSK
jgi:hypothetical protein